MSLVKLANVCSHLQNASLARLGLTSIPHTRMHLLFAVELQKQGFISNVVLGGATPPPKLLPRTQVDQDLKFQSGPSKAVREAFESGKLSMAQTMEDRIQQEVRSAVLRPVNTETQQAAELALAETDDAEDFPISELVPASDLDPESEKILKEEAFADLEPVTQTNRATRRLWLSMKYWDGEPVMRKLKMLSKPTQKLWLTHEDLGRIVRGKRANYIDGMTRVGECVFLSTDKGIMEARECVERRIGGLVLCRVWG